MLPPHILPFLVGQRPPALLLGLLLVRLVPEVAETHFAFANRAELPLQHAAHCRVVAFRQGNLGGHQLQTFMRGDRRRQFLREGLERGRELVVHQKHAVLHREIRVIFTDRPRRVGKLPGPPPPHRRAVQHGQVAVRVGVFL